MRNTMFGIQLAQHGRIVDYHCAKALFDEIFADPSEEWQHYKDKYGTMAYALHREFLALMPEKPLTDHRREKRKQWRSEKRRVTRERRQQKRNVGDGHGNENGNGNGNGMVSHDAASANNSGSDGDSESDSSDGGDHAEPAHASLVVSE
jgi:hypothetical protein